MAAAAGGWTSAVVLGAVMFPASVPIERWIVPALVALALLALARWSIERLAMSIVALVAGAGLGGIVIFAQRAPAASTTPLGGALAEVRGTETALDYIVVACGTKSIRISPVLTFYSRSSDRTWSILSPELHGSRRTLANADKTETGVRAAFVDDGRSTLVVDHTATGVEVEAVSELAAPVFSHLNSFTTIDVPYEAMLAFSPVGDRQFPIEPADYPSGRPVQLAYVDAAQMFRVVRARDAEKGPYRELAAGALSRGAPLALEIRAADKDGCRLVFDDWSSQVSTEPSPTAGWGVTQGSIQFFSRDGQGIVLVTLADTGPGRGFDTVGHAAGVYRNRMHIVPLGPLP
jgi:hypothetical protein